MLLIRRLVANHAWLELTWIFTMLLPPTTCRSEPTSSWQSTGNAWVSFLSIKCALLITFHNSNRQFLLAAAEQRCHFVAASHRIALKSPACYLFLMRPKAKKSLCCESSYEEQDVHPTGSLSSLQTERTFSCHGIRKHALAPPSRNPTIKPTY